MSRDDVSTLWRIARTLRPHRSRGKPLPPLLFFTDPWRVPSPESVVARLPAGSAVVFRTFGKPEVEAKGEALARLARGRGLYFFVGADAALAQRLNADGLHLPERLVGRSGDIRVLRRRFIVTAAAHNMPAALRARRAGVDAIVVSPVFPSQSASAGRPIGARRLAALIRVARVPGYALGGVNRSSARALWRTGVIGLAAIEGLSAHEPA